MSVRGFRAGELVRVKTPREILATLDAEGAFEGVPFMPEMLESCGETFRVQRCVEKTCVDGHPRRRFPGDAVVILDVFTKKTAATPDEVLTNCKKRLAAYIRAASGEERKRK
jgi:hypothetical protein